MDDCLVSQALHLQTVLLELQQIKWTFNGREHTEQFRTLYNAVKNTYPWSNRQQRRNHRLFFQLHPEKSSRVGHHLRYP
ncbi:hypothetical protein scyTo_0001392 [Scyliorhinus torazame]|uniref:Uncharacterized protein n=1 Tax=Scyliorhinus torazame TaxID=75743 RepID=A0A401PCM4_SCYTO|nr:hypothetical protein [Scyliorhinus torazame]